MIDVMKKECPPPESHQPARNDPEWYKAFEKWFKSSYDLNDLGRISDMLGMGVVLNTTARTEGAPYYVLRAVIPGQG